MMQLTGTMPVLTGFKEECFEELQEVLESFEFQKFRPQDWDEKGPCYHFRSEKDFVEVHLDDLIKVYRITDGPFLNEYRTGEPIEFAYDTFISVVKEYFGREVLIGVIES